MMTSDHPEGLTLQEALSHTIPGAQCNDVPLIALLGSGNQFTVYVPFITTLLPCLS